MMTIDEMEGEISRLKCELRDTVVNCQKSIKYEALAARDAQKVAQRYEIRWQRERWVLDRIRSADPSQWKTGDDLVKHLQNLAADGLAERHRGNPASTESDAENNRISVAYYEEVRKRRHLEKILSHVRDAAEKLIVMYVANRGTSHEYISCITPKHACHLTLKQRLESDVWSAWDGLRRYAGMARDILYDKPSGDTAEPSACTRGNAHDGPCNGLSRKACAISERAQKR